MLRPRSLSLQWLTSNWGLGTPNLFRSEQNNEYLLHHRRSGRGRCGRRLSWNASLMNWLVEGAQPFTSKQYLAKAVAYGDLAKTSVGSAKREEFQALEARFSVLAVLADNDELLQEKTRFSALSRTRQIERPLQPRIRFCAVLELRLLCNGTHCRLSSKENYSTMRATWASCWILRL